MSIRRYEYEFAKEALTKALEVRIRIYGNAHQETGDTRQNLASLTAARGFYAEAYQLYKDAEAATTEHSFNEKRLAACQYAANYGRCLTMQGEYEGARKNLVKSRDILKKGADNPIFRRAIEYCFGNLNLAEGKLNEARTNYLECLNGYDDLIKDKNRPLTCGCHIKLASIAMEHNHPEIAMLV